MIDGQLWLLMGFAVFTIALMGVMTILFGKWIKRRNEMPEEE